MFPVGLHLEFVLAWQGLETGSVQSQKIGLTGIGLRLGLCGRRGAGVGGSKNPFLVWTHLELGLCKLSLKLDLCKLISCKLDQD